ncbi:MAG: hypothetical protein PWP23_1158 [Candidatus Sumerlaeota bacterium]|nr:hypothetical protein [Candidatus Sumerlaeota bacterium]
MPATAVSRPLRLQLPQSGVLAAESIHGPAFRMPEEKHPFHELYFVYRGNLKVFAGTRIDPVYLSEGSLFPIERETVHRIEDQSGAVLLILALAEDFIAVHPARRDVWRILQRKGAAGFRPGLFERERIERSFRTILAEQAAARTGAELVLRSEADAILVALARLPEECRERNSYVRVADVLRSLEATFFEDWDIDLAARRAHLSRRRFSMIFREIAGMSFVDKRNELRLEYAAGLIAEGRNTIIGAAFSSGFGDLAHFYRLFRRRFGAPPGKWAGRK